jgi:glycosyltransferase 2 family protein
MRQRANKLFKFIMKLAVTAGLLLWVFSRIDSQQLLVAMKSARWEFVIAVWLLGITSVWIRSIKMNFILKNRGCNIRVRTLFGVSLVTFFYGMVLPGVLSTTVKWYILKKGTGKGINIFSGMVYSEIIEILVMVVIGLAGLMISNPVPQILPRSLCSILLAVIILGSMLLLNYWAGIKAAKIFGYVLNILPVKMRQKAEDVFEQISSLQRAGLRFHIIVSFITIIASFVGGVAVYVFSAKGANIEAPVSVFVWLCAAIYILGKLPVSIANLGIREVTLAGMLGYYGVETSSALLMSMIIFSGTIFLSIIGAFLHLYQAMKKPIGRYL